MPEASFVLGLLNSVVPCLPPLRDAEAIAANFFLKRQKVSFFFHSLTRGAFFPLLAKGVRFLLLPRPGEAPPLSASRRAS